MRDAVEKYYGETLTHSNDLQTNACCTAAAPPAHIKSIMAKIHPDVSSRYYGCGLIVPEAIEGLRILDLGCGAGQDAYILSALTGEKGHVYGVDMTDQQLAIAEQHREFHRLAFAHKESNVTFLKGQLEHLDQLDFEPRSFDLIISNCVINLCSDKHAVLQYAQKLLKPGGEMYFSDVYCDRRIPSDLQNDPILYGECLSGAFYWNDFLATAKACGFMDPRLVNDAQISVHNPDLEEKLGRLRFFSATYRLFNLPDLEPACEDYGQAVRYKGSIQHHPNTFLLDKHHLIERDKIFPVCGNTYRMLAETRLREHFEFFGNFTTHFGIFEGCGTAMPFAQDSENATPACC